VRIYEQLWNEAVTALELGQPTLDAHLLDKIGDRRRGVSLIIRLPASVQASIKEFLDAVARDFPGQYVYRAEELHVTVVTLISATEQWEEEFRDVDAFRGILEEVSSRHPPFKLEFRGVTAAPNAVMVQGFTVNHTLENIRAELRRVFAERGFPNRLDRRYPNKAAHVTAMRFCKSGSDWGHLLNVLKAHRRTHFGDMQVDMLQLILGDWYASASTVRMLGEYRLSEAEPPQIS